MLFSELVDRLHSLNQSTKRLEITQQLAAILQEASPAEARSITYLVRGEVRPQYQGQTFFGLAERSLRALVIKILAASFETDTKTIAHTLTQQTDLAEMIQAATWHPPGGRQLTVHDVYTELLQLSSIAGTGSQELRAEHVGKLMLAMRPIDAAFIIRIILGKLRLGFSDMTVLDALSWLSHGNKSQRAVLEEAFNVHADLGDIAEQVRRSGIASIKTMHITLGIPVRPAAAERLPSAQEIIEKIGTCVIQPKLDGFRLQVHVQAIRNTPPVIHFFSRNLQRMDHMFPELEAAFAPCTESIIIEGEAVAYDEENDRYLPFQETVKRRRKHGVAEAAAEYPLKFVAFDLLYVATQEILSHPHHERYIKLHNVIKQLPAAAQQTILLVPEKRATTAHEIDTYFTAQVELGFEGILAKRDTAEYQAGKRNFNWIKLKRQTIGSLSDTIDTVVLGYYYGRGKRAQFGIGACLIGVYDAKQDQFVTIAKLGTGLSDHDWRELKKQADPYASKEQPARIVCTNTLTPDVWIIPTLVVEVAADEITRSPVHTAARDSHTGYGLALRFPRMVNFRPDKNPEDATTVTEIRELFEQQAVHTRETRSPAV